MTPALYASIITLVTLAAAVWVDQRRLRCGSRFRLVLALIMLAIGSWTGWTIFFALEMQVPGAYGPVQYWVGDAAAHRFIQGPRTIAMFAMWGGWLISILSVVVTVVSAARARSTDRMLRLLVPVASWVAFGLAWWAFVHYRFFPSA